MLTSGTIGKKIRVKFLEIACVGFFLEIKKTH